MHKNPLFLPTAISKEMENSLILLWSHLHRWQINKSTPFFISSFYIKKGDGGGGEGGRGGEGEDGRERKRGRVGMRMRESEGTQADPLVSEICLLMFGLGKWKLLWRVRRINPSFLISRWRCGGREKKKGDRCVYTGGRGAMKGAIQEDLALTHGGRGRSRHETPKCGICTLFDIDNPRAKTCTSRT